MNWSVSSQCPAKKNRAADLRLRQFPPSQRGSKELSLLEAPRANESIVISLGAFRIAAIASDEFMRVNAPDSNALGSTSASGLALFVAIKQIFRVVRVPFHGRRRS